MSKAETIKSDAWKMKNRRLQEILKQYPDDATVYMRDYQVCDEKTVVDAVMYEQDTNEIIIE